MAKSAGADDKLKLFWQDNTNFAAVWNTYFFGGEERIKPDDLYGLNSIAGTEIGDGLKTLIKASDVAKLWKTQNSAQILCLENQSNVDYGMAVRELEERAAFLGAQRARIVRENRKTGRATGDRYVSGMLPQDKIVPIFILTIYYGASPWDAPLNVEEMYGEYVPLDQKYNPAGISLLQVNNTEGPTGNAAIRNLFGLLQLRYHTDSKLFVNSLAEYIRDNDVKEAEMEAFAALINSKSVIDLFNQLQKRRNQNMELSIEKWEEEWFEQARTKVRDEILELERKQQATAAQVEAEKAHVEAEKARVEAEKARVKAEKARAHELAHQLAYFIAKEGHVNNVSEDAVITEIVKRTGVPESQAHQWCLEFRTTQD